MKNNSSLNFILGGIILNTFQYIVVIMFFYKLYNYFSDYTIYNPNVINGSMQSFSFIQMLLAMLYSGVLINYIKFAAFILSILYISFTTIFLILEVVAYIYLKNGKGESICKSFFLAMGFKNLLFDISAIPFLIGGFSYKEELNIL